jgi:hypothetical protein
LYLLVLEEVIEEVTAGLSTDNFLLDFHQVQKEIGNTLMPDISA